MSSLAGARPPPTYGTLPPSGAGGLPAPSAAPLGGPSPRPPQALFSAAGLLLVFVLVATRLPARPAAVPQPADATIAAHWDIVPVAHPSTPSSPECLYRGWLLPSGACQCVTAPEGPGFFGDRCEQTRCGHHSVAQCAQHRVAPLFQTLRAEFQAKCVQQTPSTPCRLLFMKFRDSLNIFGSAYFPVKGLKMKYHDVSRCFPYDAELTHTKHKSNDPLFVLLQYTQATYQAIGDAKDAQQHKKKLAKRCEKVLQKWLDIWADLLDQRYIDDHVTWDEYVTEPGRQPWSVATPAMLYLEDRQAKAMFWGQLRPDPSLKCGDNACIMLSNEVFKARQRYWQLRETQKQGQWWQVILDDYVDGVFPNFELFHKIRKSIRTMLNTYAVLPALGLSMYLPLSPPLHQWLVQHRRSDLPANSTFGDVFCLGKVGCEPVTDVIALLMVDDRERFPIGAFWNLLEVDYVYLRALGIIGLGDIGAPGDHDLGGPTRPKATACPSVAEFQAGRVSAPFRTWEAAPGFSGTLCGLVMWMGVIHDRMIELNGSPDDKLLRDYVAAESRAVGRYMEMIDFDHTVADVAEGLCYMGVRQSGGLRKMWPPIAPGLDPDVE